MSSDRRGPAQPRHDPAPVGRAARGSTASGRTTSTTRCAPSGRRRTTSPTTAAAPPRSRPPCATAGSSPGSTLALDGPRGTVPAGLPASAFVICLQNHDQVGNRAFGERLHHQITGRRATRRRRCCSWRRRRRCCSWARSGPPRSPFLFFTDHEASSANWSSRGGAGSSAASDVQRSRARERSRPAGGEDLAQERARLGGTHAAASRARPRRNPRTARGTARAPVWPRTRPIAHQVRGRRTAWPLARTAFDSRRAIADVRRPLRKRGPRDCGPPRNDTPLQVLHATSPAPGRPIVRGVRATGTSSRSTPARSPSVSCCICPRRHRED